MKAWEQAELQVLQTRHSTFIESQKSMVDLTKMILRGTFIINGTAAAAVLAARDPSLYLSMLAFCWGAFASVCATAVTYVVQGMVTVAWHRSLCQYPFKTSPLTQIESDYIKYGDSCQRWGNIFRIVAFAFVAASLACFAFGIGAAQATLW